MAGTFAHLVNAAAYKPREDSEGVRREAGTLKV